jgi:hypothetical protein
MLDAVLSTFSNGQYLVWRLAEVRSDYPVWDV